MSLAHTKNIGREFFFSQQDFNAVVKMINQLAGITLSEHKTDMVYSRLARRLRALGLQNFDSYLQLVREDQAEKEKFVNALTTNLTHFFREKHHFDYLQQKYLPEIFAKKQYRIRFWSAGCSTGEEPYTLSMVWHSLINKPANIDFKILATDLDTNVLQACQNGIYTQEKLKPVEEKYQKWFSKTEYCKANEMQINDKLKQNIYFKQLNLIANWPMKGPFDLIICRNVLIYFDKLTQQKLVERFYNLLSDTGCLMLGHSENLSIKKQLFTPLGHTIYRKEKILPGKAHGL